MALGLTNTVVLAQSGMKHKLVFVDLETGGTDPKRHPIIQIAAVVTDDTLSPVEAFEAKVCFDLKSANKQSLRKNHYHPGTWSSYAMEPQAVACEFSTFLRRHASITKLSQKGELFQVAQLVAHNAQFDAAFLAAFYERLGAYLPANRIWLCTLQRALWFFTERSEAERPKDLKLATLCQYFGVPFHAASAHEALADVTATAALYRALLEASQGQRTMRAHLPADKSTPKAATR
jgi:DNA polymerase III epsilon subunit-like protein